MQGLIQDFLIANQIPSLFETKGVGGSLKESPKDHRKVGRVVKTVRKMWSCAHAAVNCFLIEQRELS